jgi:hypothetical protein
VRLTCPACRKVNDLAGLETTACGRCGCDLAALAAIATKARALLAQALLDLRSGSFQQAIDRATRSWSQRHSSQAAMIAALAAVAAGQTGLVPLWRDRASRREAAPDST